MHKIKLVGYFRELRHGVSDGPSLHESIGLGEYLSDKQKVISYLKSGLVYAASPGVGVDVLDASGKISGPIHSLTDGSWMWPADLVYYVEKYDISLPELFLEDLRRRNWVAPDANSVNVAHLNV